MYPDLISQHAERATHVGDHIRFTAMSFGFYGVVAQPVLLLMSKQANKFKMDYLLQNLSISFFGTGYQSCGVFFNLSKLDLVYCLEHR